MDARKNVRSRHAECGVGEAWRGEGCSSRCGVTCRDEVEITLAWVWRAAAVGGVAVWHKRRVLYAFLARPVHPLLLLLPTDPGRIAESRVDLQHPCSGAATHEAWPGSCCSACHTLDTRSLLARRRSTICRREGRRRWAAVVAS